MVRDKLIDVNITHNYLLRWSISKNLYLPSWRYYVHLSTDVLLASKVADYVLADCSNVSTRLH